MYPIESSSDRDMYRNAFDHDHAGKALLTPEGRCKAANRSFCMTLGVSEHELLGRNLIRMLEGNQPAALHSTMYWETSHTRFGRKIWLSVTVTSIPNASGKLVYNMIQIQDITNRKLYERELARLQNEKQLILDSVMEGIYGLDLCGKLTFWNRAAERLTGYTRYELAHLNILKVLHLRDQPELAENLTSGYNSLMAAINSGIPTLIPKARIWRKDGRSFHTELTASPIFENSVIIGTVITFRDITEQEQAQDQLMKSEKLILAGQLAAGVAHEIRNPLTSLKGFTQLIRSGAESKAVYFDVMLDELSRIESILNELLMLAKPQASKLRSRSMNSLLQEVVYMLSPQALTNRIEMQLELDQEDPAIPCEGKQIQQVFLTILQNAIDAMPGGGTIRIVSSTTKDSVRITVSDQGCGIPEDKLRNLGEPFYTTKDKGTGLGLMVSFKIIEHHGGSIRVRSELNKGTDFTVTLPRTASPDQIS